MKEALLCCVLTGFSTLWLVGEGWAQGSPPGIIANPSNRVAVVGGTTSFSVTATGSPPLIYRWLKDGGALAFGTNRFFTLTNLQPFQAGIYQATVSNLFGAATSQPAMLIVTSPPPTIVAQPQDALLCPNGSNVLLSVGASGLPPLRYQWWQNDTAIPNETNSFLVVTSLTASIGDYLVVVTNFGGTVTSRVARVQPGVMLLQQPVSRTVIAGSTVVFLVTARTCTQPHYQWRFNGNALPGQTTNALYLPPAHPGLNGNYDVIVSDSFGSVTSAVATLQVLPFPPAILTQPQDLLGFNDTNVLFTVSYDGYPAPSLQWRFNGIALPGETNDFLSFRPTVTSEGGYSVVLSNVYGAVTSRVATLTLLKYPPSILPGGQPQSQALCPPPAGNYLSVLVTSPAAFPPVFQWSLNGMDLPGANASWLALAGRPEEAGDYVVVVSNGFGAVTSQVAYVRLEPVITLEPDSQVLPEGSSLYLVTEASACGTIHFQWQKNGRNIEGAQQSFFYLPAVTEADEGDYTVIATHFFGAVTSSVAVVEVVQVPPEVDPGLPEDLEILAGGTANFFVSPSGAPPAEYQWRFNGVPIPGATNNMLSFVADSPQQQGRYSVVLSNSAGSVTSRVARLKLLFSPPEFLTEPDDLEAQAGDAAFFYGYADGAPPPIYQWLFNGHPLAGETNDLLMFRVEDTNQFGGYSVVASNLLGVVTSRVATLTVLVYPPVFALEPGDQTVPAGNYVYLYGAANAAPPAVYQWLFNGNPVPGQTNANFYFQAGFSNQIGGYSLVASNAYGVTTSRVAMVDIILTPPSFSLHPTNQTLVEGERLILYFAVSNNVPIFTQWQLNGGDIPGATNPALLVRTVTTNHTGDYRAIVWNDGGRATSSVARVVVRSLGALDRWTWRRSLPQGNTLYALAAGNDRVVAAGKRGGEVFSTNGLDWHDGHTDGRLLTRSTLVFGNGVFVALSDGWPEVSSNGVDWVDTYFAEDFYASSVAFGNGRFVAVGNYASVSISTNGMDWEQHDIPELERRSGEVNFANGRFFISLYATPGNGLDTGVLISTDGIAWGFHESPLLSGLREITYGPAGFVGIHEYQAAVVALSSNGTDWVDRQIPELQPMTPTSVAYGNGRYVLSGLGYLGGPTLTLATSTNGAEWTPLPGIGTNSIWKVFHDGARFIAVGQYGFIAVSANGSDWTIINPGSERNFRAISHENGLFIAVGNGGAIFTSPDGRQWNAGNSGTTNNLRAVTWFNGRFIIVGESSQDGAATILSSPDAVTWQSHTVRVNLFGVAHNGERLVAVGDFGAIVTSLDGLSWESLPFSSNLGEIGSPTGRDLNAVIWSDDRFVAVGKDGTVIHSTDGLHWITSGPGGNRNLHGIAHGNGVYVTAGNNARYYVSTDLTQWLRGDWTPREDMSDITFAGGRFMAVGDNGLVFTSEDGINWLRRVTGCDNDLRSVVYLEGSYYAAGNNDTILQSAQADAALRIARLNVAGGVQLEIRGEAGRAYRLQGSMDLMGWTDLFSFVASKEATRYVDGLSGGSDWRFYRVVSP